MRRAPVLALPDERRWPTIRLACSALLAFVLALALAGVFAAPVSADGLDDEVRQIAKELRCPVCENLSVADSPSDLAAQMRGIIRKKLEAGESRDQIVQYFVDRYGESILLSPPKSGFALAIWLGPVVGLAVGAVMVYTAYRSRQASVESVAVEPAPDDDLDVPEAVVLEDLRRYQEGISR